MSDEGVSDGELLAAYDRARGAYLIARTGGGFDIEPYAAAEAAARNRVLARMSSPSHDRAMAEGGWQPINTLPEAGIVWAKSGCIWRPKVMDVDAIAALPEQDRPTIWAECNPPCTFSTPTTKEEMA